MTPGSPLAPLPGVHFGRIVGDEARKHGDRNAPSMAPNPPPDGSARLRPSRPRAQSSALTKDPQFLHIWEGERTREPETRRLSVVGGKAVLERDPDSSGRPSRNTGRKSTDEPSGHVSGTAPPNPGARDSVRAGKTSVVGGQWHGPMKFGSATPIHRGGRAAFSCPPVAKPHPETLES